MLFRSVTGVQTCALPISDILFMMAIKDPDGYDININPIGSCTVPIKDNIIIRRITSAPFSVNANAYTNISKSSESIIKFSPVGIVGYNLEGTGTSKVSIPKVYLDGTTCMAGVRNQGSSQTGWTFTWDVMYVRTRGLYSPKNP